MGARPIYAANLLTHKHLHPCAATSRYTDLSPIISAMA